MMTADETSPAAGGAPGRTGRTARRKLSDAVYDHLVGLITESELKPGDKMPSERELMARFGVGRPAVREAMQSLANMGLISISQGERARVLEPSASSVIAQIDATARHLLSTSPAGLEHLKGARALFENAIVREAASRAGAEDIERLRTALAAQRRHVGDPAGFVAADMGFHRALARISGNPILMAASEAMLGWLAEFHIDLLRRRGHEQETLDEHGFILQRIEVHDPDGAVREMTAHLNRSRALFQHSHHIEPDA